ncbi:ribosome assembly factor SBDS [Candidatus Bathyarchaeota archaeon]|nr:MAG: ribosome assembly factor SBDS [Candidatus Bathyarchaeota archaeon]RLI22962.1 MAG: ribosome assembly factor SBDS [Candidatus Bathyarchaeota archaeon]
MGDKFVVARLTKDGERFEILVKPEVAFEYKLGKQVSISNALVYETVFTDVGKGTKPSEEKLLKAFGTTDVYKIAEVILSKGNLQLTAEQRRRLLEDKRKRIIAYISRNCIDPKTGLPHPPLRIEQAMNQIHYSIDINKSVEEQAKDIISLLRPILPIKIENVSLAIKIPSKYAAKAYGIVKGMATIKKEEWRADGSWLALIEVPAGSYGPLLERLGELTHGELETKVLR